MRTIGGLVDYLLVVAVQSFMLLQVGFFDAIRRLLGRLRPPPPLHSPAATLPPLRTVSVVLPTYNEERSIRHCLDALHHGAASLDDVEVIVVDGGCRDRTMDLVAEWSAAHPRLRLLRETSHGGRGPAVRAGVRHATGDAVLVLHADTALPALWDALLLRSLSDRAVLMTAFSFQCDRAQLAEAHSPPAGLALMEWTVNLRSR
ncbi:glycosyltransferase, family 2, partial [Emiliania huxleyi CCMP1516]|uniref:Glycosyltransferase 2-like domain-containing protein n=2 Tax=Emiliania huxleyi TaxID=2903 RepID=A0A0D3HZ88_EMIH1